MGLYHVLPLQGEWTWAMKNTSLLQNLLLYWNLTLRLFSAISRTFVVGSYPSAEMQSGYSTAPGD